jgi:hypothetical protein
VILTINNVELRKLLVQEGFPENQICLADDGYAVPTEKAVKDFGKRLLKFLFDNGFTNWEEEVFDCDDFSIVSKTLCILENARFKNQTGNENAVAVGMAWGITSEGGHAIVIAVQLVNNKFVIKYYEPQIQREDFLSICLQELPRQSFQSLTWCYL